MWQVDGSAVTNSLPQEKTNRLDVGHEIKHVRVIRVLCKSTGSLGRVQCRYCFILL